MEMSCLQGKVILKQRDLLMTRKKTIREEIDEEGTASLVSLPLSKSAPTPAPAPEVNIRVGQILFLLRVLNFPGRNRH